MTLHERFECRRRAMEMRIFMAHRFGHHGVDVMRVIHRLADSRTIGRFDAWFGPLTEIVRQHLVQGAP